MAVIVRPRFGRPCHDGCGRIVPTQRVNEIGALAQANGRTVQKSDWVCVECEKRRRGGAVVTQNPRR